MRTRLAWEFEAFNTQGGWRGVRMLVGGKERSPVGAITGVKRNFAKFFQKEEGLAQVTWYSYSRVFP